MKVALAQLLRIMHTGLGLFEPSVIGQWDVDSLAYNYNPEVNLPNSTLCEYADLGYDCEGNFVEYIVRMQAEGGMAI